MKKKELITKLMQLYNIKDSSIFSTDNITIKKQKNTIELQFSPGAGVIWIDRINLDKTPVIVKRIRPPGDELESLFL